MLEASEIYKSFDGKPVLQGVSLCAEEGEIIALLGPSGCGKTTLLRIIAGLEIADSGQLQLNQSDLTQIPVHKRGFGMVFQDYALFPHKNVWQNVAFALRMLNWGQVRIDTRVRQVLSQVGLAEFGERVVHELSGGEQQRVALARALAPYPRLLLMDEPLGSLDRALRERLMSELRSILKKMVQPEGSEVAPRPDPLQPRNLTKSGSAGERGMMTTIYVTHDQEEAFAIADRVLVMNRGRIEQTGTPLDLYRQPKSVFVARFLGMENLFEAEVVSEQPPEVKWLLGRLRVSDSASHSRPEAPILLIRPEAAIPVYPAQHGLNILNGELHDVSFRGRHQVATVRAASGNSSIELRFHFESTVPLPAAMSPICLRLDPVHLRILDA